MLRGHDRVIGSFLDGPGGGIPVGLLGAGTPQRGQGLREAQIQRLPRRCRRHDVLRVARREVGRRRSVDVGRHGESIEIALGCGDGRICIGNAPLTGGDVALGRRLLVSSRLDRGNGLVHAFLPFLNFGANIVELLLGVSDCGDEGRNVVGVGIGRGEAGRTVEAESA